MANEALGQKLKELRQLCNLTQQDAADKMGLKSKSTISMWESGKTEPDVITFLSLCCEYGVSEAKALAVALGLDGSAAMDFALVTADSEESVAEQPTTVKPFTFCPYCGEKLL